MKRIIALALTVVMVFALSIATFAEAKIPTEDFTVKATSNPPKIDGVYDKNEGWGTPIFSVKGSDVFDYVDKGDSTDFQPWPITSQRLWKKTDGSVEAMKKITFTAYAVWDSDNLYMCFVVDGNDKFYINPTGEWFGNSIQMTFGPDDQKLNYDAKANDKDGDGTYEPGYVGNEYLLAISSGGAKAFRKLGQYGGNQPSTLRGLDLNAVDNGTQQVYEVAFEWGKINVAGTEGKKIPICIALNINIDEELGQGDKGKEEAAADVKNSSYPYYNGFQIGKGIFQQSKSDIFESLHLVLTGSSGNGSSDGNTDATNATDSSANGGNSGTNGGGSSTTKDPANSSDASSAMFIVAAVAALGAVAVLKRK